MGFPNHGKSACNYTGQIEKGDLCLQIVEMNCKLKKNKLQET